SDPAICQIWGRIDYPGDGDDLAAGPALAAGVAVAGHRSIFRVELSLDDGATWTAAQLEPALNEPFTWVRWALPFDAQPGEHTMTLRATDSEGTVMDERRRPPLPDGATGWPTRTFNVDS
ncbi:MAG: molybdopterin-binding oxidoreductase, partial [Acidobacteria bacterium]|nr:molybdopterin-binding oxidoreductase [Acidobacteriota bacterium]